MQFGAIKELRGQIQAELELLAGQWEQAGGLGPVCAYTINSGGKRLRSVIALSFGTQLLSRMSVSGRTAHKALIKAACGVELLHLASLAADDLPEMDNDDMRRGRPALHKQFGVQAAMLASYALIGMGFELLSRAASEAACPAGAMSAVAEIARCGGVYGVPFGQLLDLELSRGVLHDRAHMVDLKTGAVFEMAFWCGWGFGSSCVDLRSQLEPTAKAFGRCFQYIDDLEDVDRDSAANCVSGWGYSEVLMAAQAELQRFKALSKNIGWQDSCQKELCGWLEKAIEQRERAKIQPVLANKAL